MGRKMANAGSIVRDTRGKCDEQSDGGKRDKENERRSRKQVWSPFWVRFVFIRTSCGAVNVPTWRYKVLNHSKQ